MIDSSVPRSPGVGSGIPPGFLIGLPIGVALTGGVGRSTFSEPAVAEGLLVALAIAGLGWGVTTLRHPRARRSEVQVGLVIGVALATGTGPVWSIALWLLMGRTIGM